MERVYANSEEKFLKAIVLYADENNYLAYDSEFDTYVEQADMTELAKKFKTTPIVIVTPNNASAFAVSMISTGFIAFDYVEGEASAKVFTPYPQE